MVIAAEHHRSRIDDHIFRLGEAVKVVVVVEPKRIVLGVSSRNCESLRLIFDDFFEAFIHVVADLVMGQEILGNLLGKDKNDKITETDSLTESFFLKKSTVFSLTSKRIPAAIAFSTVLICSSWRGFVRTLSRELW